MDWGRPKGSLQSSCAKHTKNMNYFLMSEIDGALTQLLKYIARNRLRERIRFLPGCSGI